ncbi:MAG: GNAT family N-acetyltransferase [Chloroflexota bacterium]|nr:GNAT family N-acetyltransferase [Chloroflexota bacterium]
MTAPAPANTSPTDDAPTIELTPASQFTLDELVAAYNQTRVDYIVPMPMNTARLREYVRNYDVDLERSFVARAGDQILGLAMLGVRPGHTWVTRLGIIPVQRRCGAGQMLMEELVAHSRRLKVSYVTLDVIQNNEPAHRLFLKLGFHEVRELMVIRRPPGPLPDDVPVPSYTSQILDHRQAAELLDQRRSAPSWLTENRSLINAGNLAALRAELGSGGRGWLVYQKTIFQLGRLVLQTEAGDPHAVCLALIHALHTRHPALDTKSENLPVQDQHWPAMQELGYLESFRRIEMHLDPS